MKHIEKALAFLLLISYSIKTHVQGAEFADSFIIAGLAGFAVLISYLELKKQPDIKAELLLEMDQREKAMIEVVAKQEAEITRLKDDLGQVGIVAQRNGGNVQKYKF